MAAGSADVMVVWPMLDNCNAGSGRPQPRFADPRPAGSGRQPRGSVAPLALGINPRFRLLCAVRPKRASGGTLNVAWLLAGVAAWLAINLALVYLRSRRSRDEEGQDRKS